MLEFVKLILELNLKAISNLFGMADSIFFSKIAAWFEKKLLPKVGDWNGSSIRLAAASFYFSVAAIASTSMLLLLTGSGIAFSFNPAIFVILYLGYFAASAGAFIWAIRAFNKFKNILPKDLKTHWLETRLNQVLELLISPIKSFHEALCAALLNKVKNWGPTTVKVLGTLYFWAEEFLIIESAFILLGAIFAPSFSVIAPLTFAGLILSFTPGFITTISAYALISEGIGGTRGEFIEKVNVENSRLKNAHLQFKLQQHQTALKSSDYYAQPEQAAAMREKPTYFNPLYALYQSLSRANVSTSDAVHQEVRRKHKERQYVAF